MDEPDQFLKELEDYLSSLVYDPPFLDPNETPSRSLLEEVSRQMAKETVIARSLGGALPGDKEIRFLFFNKMNLAIKAQLGSTTGKGGLSIGSDVALSLLDIKQDFDRYGERERERESWPASTALVVDVKGPYTGV
jgi:hypothetical protein